jgi:hypothetical protein
MYILSTLLLLIILPTSKFHVFQVLKYEGYYHRDLYYYYVLSRKMSHLNFFTINFSPECEESLVQGLSLLTVRSSISDVINTAYRSDERIKKGGDI